MPMSSVAAQHHNWLSKNPRQSFAQARVLQAAAQKFVLKAGSVAATVTFKIIVLKTG